MIKQIKKLSGIFTIWLILVGIVFPQVNNPDSITIERDRIKLYGKFFSAEGTGPFSTVIMLHGFPGNEKDVLGLGKRFSEAGINAVTFNYSGTFGSEGLYSFVNSQKDIKAAYDFLHKKSNVERYKIDTTEIILGGYSYGGGMALTYAANHPETNRVFSVAGTDHGEFMREYAGDSDFVKMIDPIFEELKAPQGPVKFEKGSLPPDVIKKGIENIDPNLDLKIAAPLLKTKAIFLVAGWDDMNVTMENYMLPLYRTLRNEGAKHLKIITFQDDHSFKNVRTELADAIIKWIKSIPH